MTDNTPTPVPSAAAPSTGLWIPVSHQLVRRHDGSVISSHCCSTCGMQALQGLTLAGIIGPDSPGPLEEVWVDLLDVATSQAVAFTWGLTPLNGEPTDVYSWP